ncbi:ester cyclase [Colwellia psychrerythraea]|uniref:Ester cyclase n=1 Tax=Colwellia psychrerythraea TaxID=28229 RepID=A0A099L6P9_COLPS|nr:ester cyclase [Colwellia psychrerythraea]KGJ97558.1 protein of unknown function DUF1486 [Colwellia psychrerythraea]
MILDNNIKLIKRYYHEVWNEGNLAVLDEIMSPKYINHTPGMPNPLPGPEGFKPIVIAMRTGLPDLRFEINDMVVTEDKVAIRCTMYGTHLGELFGVAATGKTVEINQMQVEYIKAGKIVEHWRVSDDLMAQLDHK